MQPDTWGCRLSPHNTACHRHELPIGMEDSIQLSGCTKRGEITTATSKLKVPCHLLDISAACLHTNRDKGNPAKPALCLCVCVLIPPCRQAAIHFCSFPVCLLGVLSYLLNSLDPRFLCYSSMMLRSLLCLRFFSPISSHGTVDM